MGAISSFAFAAVLFLLTASGLRAEEPAAIVLDSWWNRDSAKHYCAAALAWFKSNRSNIERVGCNATTACPEMKPIVDACRAPDPVAEVRDFEGRLTTYMATDPQCKGVRVVHYRGPSGANISAAEVMQRSGYWTLYLDYMPGAKRQPWELVRNKSSAYAKGDGGPSEVAASACAIVTGRSSKLD